MDTLKALNSRKSVREYLDRTVESEKLETVLTDLLKNNARNDRV